MKPVALYVGEELGRYGFPEGHPFGPDRQRAFYEESVRQGLDARVTLRDPVMACTDDLEAFQTPEYVRFVRDTSARGHGYLDYGDTPAFPGAYEAAAHVAGSALDGLELVMDRKVRRTFQAIGGLHHAQRGAAAGFCIFNDTGIIIETLKVRYGIHRVAYIDIDVHHGDGVFYAYESDPDVLIVDIHQDGRTLYPGTGHETETGKGMARDTKLNFAMRPGAGDEEFLRAWGEGEKFLRRMKPDFVILQCGADSIAGDPLAMLSLTPNAHATVARSLCGLAEDLCEGRIMGFGGGGYNRRNLALGWNGVLKAFVET